MSKYFILKPEVAGGFGENTIMIDPSARPPRFSRFHYQFDGWLGDELLTTVACFIVTKNLGEALRSCGLTGFSIGDVEVTKSSEYERRTKTVPLPPFYWLKIEGNPAQDDFGLAADRKFRLVVSEDALNVLKQHSLNHCEILPY
jgi:uncharacterized repeat protein (TIGR02543 family)